MADDDKNLTPPGPAGAPVTPAAPAANQTPPTDEGDAGDDLDGADDDGGDATAQPGGKKPLRGVQKRINELRRDKGDLQRDRDYWRNLALQSNQRNAGEQPAAPKATESVPAAPSGEPTLEQHGYDVEKYTQARIAWELKQSQAAAEKTRNESEAQTARKQRFLAHQERERSFAAGVEDYSDVVMDRTLPISDAMVEAIVESEHGPAVMYHLGKHRDEATAIARMSPIAAAAAIGRIEARITATNPATPAAPAAPSKPTTAAPAVPPSVKPTAPVEKDPKKMTTEEWMRHRNRTAKP